jgi:two-component system, LytTR family, response regulator AlgR
MRVLIADDEPLARARMVALVGECADVQIVGSVGDGEAALAACIELKPDVLLLDIEMPGINGTALARRLAAMPGAPQIIFCTAYDQHAVQAWEVGAADYLLKPVRIERLREALQRAGKRMPSGAVTREQGTWLHARAGGERIRIDVDDVLYLLADEKYVAVHHRGGVWLIDESLRQLEQAHATQLVRLHRNCLVPQRRLIGLKTLADGRVLARLAGTEVMPEVSRRNLVTVRQLLRAP